MSRIADEFGQVEPRASGTGSGAGAAVGPATQNCWSIAEWVGEATPEGMHHRTWAAGRAPPPPAGDGRGADSG
ncbi:hypothetical protein GCM10010344_63630 [Streptomyces bluensis]|nr:hypothetical protein GCM10010344_63630 [Streptomyces bluensis]